MASPEPLASPRLAARARSSRELLKVMPVYSGFSSVNPVLPSRGTGRSAHRNPVSGCHTSSAAQGSIPSAPASRRKTNVKKNLMSRNAHGCLVRRESTPASLNGSQKTERKNSSHVAFVSARLGWRDWQALTQEAAIDCSNRFESPRLHQPLEFKSPPMGFGYYFGECG